MPHLQYLNHYWRVGGDEFAVPAICTLIGRVFWLVLLAVILASSLSRLANCGNGIIIICYLLNTLGLFLVSAIVDGFILAVSLQGSIAEPEKRSSLPGYLTIRMMVGFLQFLMSIFGIISLARAPIPCNDEFQNDDLTNVFIYIVVISQLVDVFMLMCCCYLFSSHRVDRLSKGTDRSDELTITRWTNKCEDLIK
jgi:glycerol-3-phosphate acyltransferase PlsY